MIATVAIPETVDLAAFVTQAIAAMGSIATIVVGGYFAFLLIKRGLQWARRSLDDDLWEGSEPVMVEDEEDHYFADAGRNMTDSEYWAWREANPDKAKQW